MGFIRWLVIIKAGEQKNKTKTGEDPIVTELKEKSPIIIVSDQGKPLELTLIRGGDHKLKGIKGFSFFIRNKKLAALIKAIVQVKHNKQKQAKLLQIAFFIANELLTNSTGLRVAIGGALGYTQVVVFLIPTSMLTGYIVQFLR